MLAVTTGFQKVRVWNMDNVGKHSWISADNESMKQIQMLRRAFRIRGIVVLSKGNASWIKQMTIGCLGFHHWFVFPSHRFILQFWYHI